MRPQKVIVIGGSHHNTLGVIRSLGRKGLRPFVIVTSGSSSSFVLKSKYIEKGWLAKDSNEAFDLLINELASDNEKGVLIACHDIISSILDLRREELLPYFVVPGSTASGKITYLMDKKKMGDLALQTGLNVPKTIIANKDNVSFFVDSIAYPCITKPIESKSGSKGEIVVCKNREELQSFLASKVNSYIIQQYIDKQIEFQLIGCSLNGGEDIVIPGVSIILRQEQSSNTGFLHYTKLDDSFHQTVMAAKAFIKETGYSGLFSVEFLREKEGLDYFMEINFRNDGNSIAVTNAGVNLPYIWYLYCIGKDYKSEIVPIHDEFVMPEFAELLFLQNKIVSWRQWKKDMKIATSYMDYAADDPSPTEGWKLYKNKKRMAIVKRIANALLLKK